MARDMEEQTRLDSLAKAHGLKEEERVKAIHKGSARHLVRKSLIGTGRAFLR